MQVNSGLATRPPRARSCIRLQLLWSASRRIRLMPISPGPRILRFGPDGKRYVTSGETNHHDLAQDLGSLGGKILRLNADGSIPAGNPSATRGSMRLGLRNSFGMVFHPQTGDLWITENGPDCNDEVNRIVAGGNYGWPIVTGNDPRFRDPIVAFTPTIGPTGLVTIPKNSLYPSTFHNNLLFADVNGGKLHRIVLAGIGAQLDHLGSASIAPLSEPVAPNLTMDHDSNRPSRPPFADIPR